MSIQDHKWSDPCILVTYVAGESVFIRDTDGVTGFNKQDATAIAKHFNADREALMLKLKSERAKYMQYISDCGDDDSEKGSAQAVFDVLDLIIEAD